MVSALDLMRLLSVAATAALLIPWPTHPDYPALARWAGCHATVTVDTNESIGRSRYVPYADMLYLGTGDPDLPDEVAIIVLFHEAAHCVSTETGRMAPQDYMTNTVFWELDADRYAAEMACAMDMDGPAMLRHTFQWARDQWGYEGDPWHGSLDERIDQADNARSCHMPHERQAG